MPYMRKLNEGIWSYLAWSTCLRDAIDTRYNSFYIQLTERWSRECTHTYIYVLTIRVTIHTLEMRFSMDFHAVKELNRSLQGFAPILHYHALSLLHTWCNSKKRLHTRWRKGTWGLNILKPSYLQSVTFIYIYIHFLNRLLPHVLHVFHSLLHSRSYN